MTRVLTLVTVVSNSGRVHRMERSDYIEGSEQRAICGTFIVCSLYSPQDDGYRPRCRICFHVIPG